MICVMREVNGVWKATLLADQSRYREFVGCFTMLLAR